MFALTLTLFLGLSQFTDAVRAAFDVRLTIAADDVASALQDALRVGVTIQRSPSLVALLRRAQGSDSMIAAIALRDPTGQPIVEVGDARAASADPRLTIERSVVSDFGVTVADVRVTARRALFARQTAEATHALLIPAVFAALVGSIATATAVILAMWAFGRREHARRRSLADALDERIAAAERALAEAEALL